MTCLLTFTLILYGCQADQAPRNMFADRHICFCAVVRLTCPPRKDEADWLVELTGSAGEAYRADPAERMALGLGKVPVTAEEFHAKWLQSDGGKTIEKVGTVLDFATSIWCM